MVEYNGASLANIVKGNTVVFEFARKSELWYKVVVDGSDLLFPVPFEDMGDGTFLKSDKATMFMRYIRKHLEELIKEL